MQITKELLEDSIKQAESARKQYIASANMAIGRIQILKEMLAYIEKQEASSEKPE